MARVIQGQVAWLDFYLTNKSDDEPRTGLVWDDVIIEYKRATDNIFTTLVLAGASEFNEVGNGVYNAKFPASVFDVLGTFRYVVNGTPALVGTPEGQVWQWLDFVDVVAASSVAPVEVSLSSCNLWGNVADLTGYPKKDVAIGIKILGTPQLLSDLNETPRAAITTEQFQTQTDENGFFYFTVVRNSVVRLTIPSTGYIKEFTVPNSASANVFEI